MKTLTFLVVVVLGLGSLNAGQAAESPSRPEAVGGKHYSLDECMRIARWVIGQPKNAENLTGVDLGNLWYTLDSCGYLYFSDAKTLSRVPSMDQVDLDTAIDWATHEYIGRLEGAILRLPDIEKNKALGDLRRIQRPFNGPPPWAQGKP